MRRTAAGARQLTVFLIKIKHLRRGERAVVARFAAEGDMHRHNHNAVLFRLDVYKRQLPDSEPITVLMRADATSTLYLTQRFSALSGDEIVPYRCV